MPLPTAKRPMTMVVMDQTLNSVELPKDGFIAGKAKDFGIFERWILRVGYFTTRRSGLDAIGGDVLVFLYPNKPVTDEYRSKLAEYVKAGGHVLVIDAEENAQ